MLGLKFFGFWLIIVALTGLVARWVGAWALILPPLGFLVTLVAEGGIGSRSFIWELLTTHCPECGTWPMRYSASPKGDDHGFLICEKCQIEWDLGQGTGISGNAGLTAVFEGSSDIIDKHIQNNEPPETRRTMERLTKEGHTVDEARQLILTAVVVEVFHQYVERKPSDAKRFAWNLEQLPRKPWDAQGREIFYRQN